MTREDLIESILEAKKLSQQHKVVRQNPDKRRVGWWANENAVFLDLKRGQNPSDVDIRKQPSWKSLHRHIRKHQKTRKYMQYWDDDPKPQHVTTAGMKRVKAKGLVGRILRHKRSERVLYR
jgi:hypothetical protein